MPTYTELSFTHMPKARQITINVNKPKDKPLCLTNKVPCEFENSVLLVKIKNISAK